MKIAITGASGFVGLNLFDYLKNDYELKLMSVRYKIDQSFDIQENGIIHLAGKAHDIKNVSNPKEYYEANFELTKQIFDAFLDSKATLFIFMSTVKAVADEVDGILTEECLPRPKTHYGISKRQAEEYILSRNIASEKKVFIIRPCMIHGIGNKGNLNLLYQLVAKGFPWPLGAFDNKRSFLSVENLCFIVKELLESKDVPNGIYHMADDDSLSTNEVIRLIGINLGKKNKIWKIPTILIKSMAKLGNYLHLPLNTERMQKLTGSYIVSNAKIKKEIKKQLPVSVKEGLIKTINSFKINK